VWNPKLGTHAVPRRHGRRPLARRGPRRASTFTSRSSSPPRKAMTEVLSPTSCRWRPRSRRQAAEHTCCRPRSSTVPHTGHTEASTSVRTPSGLATGRLSGEDMA
jgi:hypothetical protein